MPADPPPLVTHWERTLGEIMDKTTRFPRTLRYTLSARIDLLGIHVLERLSEARFAPPGRCHELLREVDASLLRLRVLLRLAESRQCLDPRGYEHLIRHVDQAGRMVGGGLRGRAP